MIESEQPDPVREAERIIAQEHARVRMEQAAKTFTHIGERLRKLGQQLKDSQKKDSE